MLRTRGGSAVVVAVLAATTFVGGFTPAPAGGAPPAPADPSPTFPPLASWLNVFDDDFDGTFNGQSIVDAKNIDGQSVADGIDDRVWVDMYGSATADAVSVSSTAPGGDPGGGSGYLRMRSFTSGGSTHSANTLATGETGENPGGTTRGFFEATYGYAEARVKLVQPEGVTSAFWMYSRDLHWNYSKPLRDPANAGIEVDVFEEWDDPARISHTTHWDGYADTHQGQATGNTVVCPGSPCGGNFHTYGVLWGPTGYRYFIDGQETGFMARGASHHPEFFLISTLPEGGHDFGPLGAATNAEMLVDYVKVWQPALPDFANRTATRNVPFSIPFQTSAIVTEQTPGLPGPRVGSLQIVSSNTGVIKNTDLVITGTGADRTLTVLPSGTAGTTTLWIVARAPDTSIIASDVFDVTVSDPAASLPTLSSGALPDKGLASSTPTSVAFATAAAEGPAPTVTAVSSNQYLLPNSGLGVTTTGQTRALSITPLPTRTGTADITITVTDPADSSTSTDTFKVTVTHAKPANPGFESGLSPWVMVGGTGAPASGAARTGSQGFHMDIGAMKQKIAVEPNSTYAIGAWGRTSAAGGSFQLGIVDLDKDVAGDQQTTTTFTSTSWTRKDLVFTTGKFTEEVEVFVNNYLVSSVGFDVDDFYLADGPEVRRIADQSIGHSTCVSPVFWVGRVGAESAPWTVTAAVVGGDTSLITGVTVVSSNAANLYERRLRITPTTDTTKSGSATVRVTATDVEGRSRTDDITVWVNAGSFRNGSFEHVLTSNYTYPGCAAITAGWDKTAAPNSEAPHIDPYNWATGYKNPGLIVRTAGIMKQNVTGLQANTEYILSGWVGLQTWPDTVTLPDGAGLRISGDVTPLNPTTGESAKKSTGWQQLSVRFRTGSAGTATVQLFAPNHPTYEGRFHDITLTKAP